MSDLQGEVLDQFRAALADRGIVPPSEIVSDGRLMRCPTVDRPRKRDAAYVLHLDGWPAGGYQNHRDGLGWQNWRADIAGRKWTCHERAMHSQRMQAVRRQREAEQARLWAEARVRAATILRNAGPADPQHPYLKAKGIGTHGARMSRGDLVLPLHDAAGTLHSLEFIRPDGTKRFLYGGRKKGCYCAIGKPGAVICIAEGFATAATIREATGYAVAVAFDAGNLLLVGEALRAKFLGLELRFCADDDYLTPDNPGLTKAIEAARAVGGTVVVPEFGKVTP